MTRRNPSAPRARPRRRRGSQTIELILVLPILLIVTFAIFQFGILMTVHQAVTHAATVAAREAGKGATAAQLECVVEEVLKPHGLTVGDCVSVVLEDGEGDPDAEQIGAVACNEPASPDLAPGFVRVTVCVSTSGRPFINPLACYGFNLYGRRLSVSAVAAKEQPTFPIEGMMAVPIMDGP